MSGIISYKLTNNYRLVVPVAQLDRVLASEAKGGNSQAIANTGLTGNLKDHTPEITPSQPQFAPELQEIIDCWSDLPEYIKQAIKALTQTHITE